MLPIALLVLLPALVLSEPYTLKWNKCGKEYVCFCLDGGHLYDKFAPDGTDYVDNNMCTNVGMRSQYLNDDVAVFQMQIVGDDARDLIDGAQLVVVHENIEIFGCKFNKASGTIELVGKSEMIETYKIELFEKRSFFESGNVLCAIKVERATKMATTTLANRYTQMKLRNAIEKPYKFLRPTNDFFAPKSGYLQKCNPYLFQDRLISKEHRVQPLLNRDEDILDCKNYGPLYKMRYQTTDEDNSNEMIQLECVPASNTNEEYSYRIARHDRNGETEYVIVKDPEIYTFYCAANFAEICSDPRGDCTSNTNPECLKYTEGSPGIDAKLTCDDNRYVIDNEYVRLQSEPVCKQDGNQNEAAFFFTISGEEYKKPDAKCFKDYSCEKYSDLQLSCNNATKCGMVDQTDGILKCKDEERQLTIYSVKHAAALANVSTSYTCNSKTGKYENGLNEVPVRSRVSCFAQNRTQEVAKQILEDWQVVAIIAGIFLLCAGAIAMIWLLVSCCRRRRKEVGIAGKRGWLKLKNPKERLVVCQRIFENIQHTTTPDTANNITNGLNFIDMLLETETHDPECWELALTFLMRFQGAIIKIEHNVWHMFSRYMYIQAKKIIDKHGWLAPKPIKNKRRKGLIRTVALKLLSLSLGDPTNGEAAQMVQEGFRKLKFKAISQYPHCGVMWSLILHAYPHSDFVNNQPVNFDWKKFMGYLKAIVQHAKITIPKEDIIPGFGSIGEQAAFAFGGSPNTYYLISDDPEISEPMSSAIFFFNDYNENGAIQTSYFSGMVHSLTRNPAAIILPACDMWPSYNPEFLEKIEKIVVVQSEWSNIVDRAVKLVTFYGRHLDAKRLLYRFSKWPQYIDAENPTPEEKRTIPPQTKKIEDQLNSELNKLHEEQLQFEEAIEIKKDDLIRWFAKRTDKEELKKKQPIINIANAKIDSRIKGQGVKNVEGGTKSNSNSNSDNEKGSQTPQSEEKGPEAATPAPPAATAAAAASPAAPIVPAATPPNAAAAPAVPVAQAAAPAK